MHVLSESSRSIIKQSVRWTPRSFQDREWLTHISPYGGLLTVEHVVKNTGGRDGKVKRRLRQKRRKKVIMVWRGIVVNLHSSRNLRLR